MDTLDKDEAGGTDKTSKALGVESMPKGFAGLVLGPLFHGTHNVPRIKDADHDILL